MVHVFLKLELGWCFRLACFGVFACSSCLQWRSVESALCVKSIRSRRSKMYKDWIKCVYTECKWYLWNRRKMLQVDCMYSCFCESSFGSYNVSMSRSFMYSSEKHGQLLWWNSPIKCRLLFIDDRLSVRYVTASNAPNMFPRLATVQVFIRSIFVIATLGGVPAPLSANIFHSILTVLAPIGVSYQWTVS